MAEKKKETFSTSSGIDLEREYSSTRRDNFDDQSDLGSAGEFPYTRGIYPDMYRGKHWTMRQYAGSGDAGESNRRFRYLLDQGQTGLSVAFDLPTQIGLDSDHPLAHGEVGKVGVAVNTIRDMDILFADIPMDRISVSMTINSTAAILLAMYLALAEKRGIPWHHLTGTIQNDILKEYIARGTYIFPPGPSMRIIMDTLAFCRDNVPKWNTMSISGYHIREAGANAVQEAAFTLANAIAYVQAAEKAGMRVDDFAPRLSFFLASHNNFLEEIAKFRAVRKHWARLMRDRFHAKNPQSWKFRFHTQTSGASLVAQEPDNNIVRVTLQALAAVLGGTQSLHTNSRDEALALPSRDSARIALRTQQIIAYESGISDTVDPLGGSYAIESLTLEIEAKIAEYLQRIENMGGMLKAIESGFVQREIQNSAYSYHCQIEDKKKIIAGLNAFQESSTAVDFELYQPPPEVESTQIAHLQKIRGSRDPRQVSRNLTSIKEAAAGKSNLMPLIIQAVKNYATLGEITQVLTEVFGTYQENLTV